MESPRDHLKAMEKELVSRGLEVELGEANDRIPFPHSLITLYSDSDESEAFMLILSAANAEDLEALFLSAGEIDLIDILYPFPYEVVQEHAGEVVRLLHLLNKIGAMGTFGYDAREKRCFYRYVYPLQKTESNYATFGAVLLLVQELLSMYVSAIEDVSTGVVSMDDLLTRFQRIVDEETS